MRLRYTRQTQANHALQPTPDGARISAFAGHVVAPAWLSLGRSAEGLVMNPESLALLSAISNCHGKLRDHAIRLRDRPAVREVTHVCDIPALDGAFRVEVFVDAELVSGDAISWFLEVTVTLDGVAVEADVRRIHSQGQDLLVSIAAGTYMASDAAQALPEITQRLCSAVPI